MKHLIFSLSILILIAPSLHAQDDSSYRQKLVPEKVLRAHDFYLQKSKVLIPTGAVLLGAGIAAIIGGTVGTAQRYDIFTGQGSGYLLLGIFGIGATATGIPLLIKGLVYHSRANLILIKENVSKSSHLPIRSNLVSAGIAISL